MASSNNEWQLWFVKERQKMLSVDTLVCYLVHQTVIFIIVCKIALLIKSNTISAEKPALKTARNKLLLSSGLPSLKSL